jgi:hypothetical protein
MVLQVFVFLLTEKKMKVTSWGGKLTRQLDKFTNQKKSVFFSPRVLVSFVFSLTCCIL